MLTVLGNYRNLKVWGLKIIATGWQLMAYGKWLWAKGFWAELEMRGLSLTKLKKINEDISYGALLKGVSDITYLSEFTLDKLGKFVKGSIRRRSNMK